MGNEPDGQMTAKVAETLSKYYESKGYNVLCDHGPKKENVGTIVSWFGGEYNRETELSQIDIAIVEKASDRAYVLIEIEETNDKPKLLLGNAFGILLGNKITFRGKPILVGDFTTLLIFGICNPPHTKRNEYLRDQVEIIKLHLSTPNSKIGNIVIETFIDGEGVAKALYSKIIGSLKRGDT
jgi:hypothetical protein